MTVDLSYVNTARDVASAALTSPYLEQKEAALDELRRLVNAATEQEYASLRPLERSLEEQLRVWRPIIALHENLTAQEKQVPSSKTTKAFRDILSGQRAMLIRVANALGVTLYPQI